MLDQQSRCSTFNGIDCKSMAIKVGPTHAAEQIPFTDGARIHCDSADQTICDTRNNIVRRICLRAELLHCQGLAFCLSRHHQISITCQCELAVAESFRQPLPTPVGGICSSWIATSARREKTVAAAVPPNRSRVFPLGSSILTSIVI